MKYPLFIALTALLASCSSSPETVLAIKNNSDREIKDASAVITYAQIADQAKTNADALPALVKDDGTYIPTQVDDLDGDGTWDELFLVTDINAGEEIPVTLSFLAKDAYPEFKVRTNIRFAKKDEDYKEVTEAVRETHATNTITQEVWQMEGIAFENDMIGFRNYFDQRNGMDIFGKLTTEMVMDKVGYKDYPEYHSFNPEWGLDVLKVGKSLGAGSIAYMYKDSLYRIGDSGKGTCTVIAEGPLRSMFRFNFYDWQMGEEQLNVEQIVSIQAGTHYFESNVKYEGTSKNIELVTGIVNKKSKELFEAECNADVKAFYTFDLQSEDTTLLGMGIMAEHDSFLGTSETARTGEGITETYCIHLKTEENTYSNYRFYAVWEHEDGQWKTAEGFEGLLREDAEQYSSPIHVHIKK